MHIEHEAIPEFGPHHFQALSAEESHLREEQIGSCAREVISLVPSCSQMATTLEGNQIVDIEGTQVVLRKKARKQENAPTQTRQVEDIGPIIDPTVKRKEEATVARFVLTHPSEETRDLVYRFFTNLGKMVKSYHLNDQDFEILLSSVPSACSRFSRKQAPDPAERKARLKELVFALKHFKDLPKTWFNEHFKQCASDMITLSTAIGYQTQGISMEENTSERLRSFLKELEFEAPRIGQEFPDRSKTSRLLSVDTVSGPVIPSGIQDEVEGGLPGPQSSDLPFLNIVEGSYVAKALAKRIAMRLDVSGSASLSLGAIRSIFEKGKKGKKMDDMMIVKFGGILCATYMLGDFHSFTETAAGVANFYQNYTQSINFRPHEEAKLQEVSPKTFLALSAVYLSSIVSEESLPDFTELMQEVIEDVK